MVLTVTSSPIAFPLLVILDAGNSPRRRPQQTAHPRSNWSLWVEIEDVRGGTPDAPQSDSRPDGFVELVAFP